MTHSIPATLAARCTECENILPVTAQMLSAGAGLICCGECDTVFNGAWNLVEQIPTPVHSGQSENRRRLGIPTDRDPVPTNTGFDRRPRLFNLSDEHLLDLDLPASDTEGLDEIKRALSAETGFGAAADRRNTSAPSQLYRGERGEPRLGLLDNLQTGNASLAQATATASDASWRRAVPAPRKSSHGLVWLTGSVLLAVMLFTQVRYLLFDEFAAIPSARPYLISACSHIGCSVPEPLTGPIFRVVETKVDLHPDIPGAVIVKVRLLNRSAQERPYPMIELALSDRNGRIVGRRAYAPESFLATGDLNEKVSPGTNVTVILNLAQPEDNAVGFEARIVSA